MTTSAAQPKQDLQAQLTYRYYQPSDYKQLCDLMKTCFADMGEAHVLENEMNLMHRLYQRGQLVCMLGDKLVGACTSRIVPYKRYVIPHTQEDAANIDIFETDALYGDTVYGLDVFVDPNYSLGIGKHLVSLLEKNIFQDNFKAFIGMSRVTNYAQHANKMTCRTYFLKVKNRELADPVLGFHLRNGMNYACILPNYSPNDAASAGYGIMLQKLNPNYKYDQPIRSYQANESANTTSATS